MNICLLNDSFPPLIDGVANAVVNYAKHINDRGSKAFVVTPEYPGADDSGFEFPVYRFPGIDFRKSIGYVAGYPFSPTVAKKIKDEAPDILHSHCPMSSNLLARSIRKNLDVPFVMTYHTKFDIEIEEAIRGELLQGAAISALINNISCCDEVWTVSDGAGKSLQEIGYQGDYIVMPNGVDIPKGRLPEEVTRRLTSGYFIPDGVPVYLFVGRLMWYKGIRIILDALAGIKDQGFDFRMVFVGGGQDEKSIRAYCENLRLSDKVIFVGMVYDREVINAWYCRSDLFLFPSDFDTNGLVVREAAACSLPSVLLKGSCAAEGVTNNTDGYLIERSAASLSVLLATEGRDLKKLRAVGEKAAEDLYLSWNEAVDNAMERYQIVTDKYRSGGYAKKTGPLNGYLSLQGTLMDILGGSRQQDRSGPNRKKHERL